MYAATFPAKHLFYSFRLSPRSLAAGALLLALSAASAQTPSVAPASQDQKQSAPALPHPTTTVEVHSEVKDDYLSGTANAGTLDNLPLIETPLSVTAVSRAVLNDQIVRVLSDVVKDDASVAEDYAPVGYYGGL